MKKTTIAILGAGGREHALAGHFLSSAQVDQVHVLPGNAGMDKTQGLRSWVEWDQQLDSLQVYISQHQIAWVYVSPDSYLAQGWVDRLQIAGIKAFGPTQQAAQIESSKSYAKDCMLRAQIPTAQFFKLTEDKNLESILANSLFKKGVVIKADGLAAGKGVEVFDEASLALSSARQWLQSGPILIEERLSGPEVSSFFMCDENEFIYLGSACDHKRRFEGDKGPNTGGMGAYVYHPDNEDVWIDHLSKSIVQPLLAEMSQQGTPFRGVLFIGLMLTDTGPMVLEFNARWGDPETQCLLPLLSENLFDYCQAIIEKTFKPQKKSISRLPLASVHVVKVSKEYPAPTQQPGPIWGLEQELPRNTYFYSSGISKQEGQSVNTGGRVFGITAVAESLSTASELAYQALELIDFKGSDYRRDIGCQKP